MKRSNQHLVIGHLETISSDVFERFGSVITTIVDKQNGVYALYKGSQLYYVGLARNLKARLKAHTRDKHKGLWDRFSVYLTNGDAHTKELESLMLRVIKPAGNSVKGKLKGSVDKRRELKQRIRAEQQQHLQGIIGRTEKDGLRKPTPTRRNSAAQAHGITGVVFLKAIYKGREYRATLQKDGTVKMNGKTYGSLSGSGKSITGRATNGRHFWRARNADKEWVRLFMLKN